MVQANNSSSKMPRQKPRTCVACRSESPKRALLRVVRKPESSGIDTAVVDPMGKLPGRGAYICANLECLEKARKTGALARALKLSSLPDECYEELAQCIENYIDKFGADTSCVAGHDGSATGENLERQETRLRELRSLIGLSRRAGLVKIGTDAIDIFAKSEAKSHSHGALLVLTARDCSEAVTRFAENLIANHNCVHDYEARAKKNRNVSHEHHVLPFTVEELSAALGAGKVQIIALSLRSGLSDKIKILILG